jgi:hypothetical protein
MAAPFSSGNGMEDTKMTEWHHEDTDHLLHEQRSILIEQCITGEASYAGCLGAPSGHLAGLSLTHESAQVTSSYLSAVASI